MTKDEVLEALARERRRLLAAVDALGDGDGVAVTEPGGWTAKDVLAHLIHYAGQIAFALGAPLRPPSYVVANLGRQLDGQGWNDLAVEHWRLSSLADVRAEFERMADAVEAAVAGRTDADLAGPATHVVPWAGDHPLWRFVGGDTFLHEWPAHAAQIEAAYPR